MADALGGGLKRLLLIGVLLAGCACYLRGQVVGAVSVSPTSLQVSTSTTPLVTVQIPAGQSVLPNGVNLLRLNASGTPTVVGVMHDDGLSGDATAGDGIYSYQFTDNESVPGQFQLQCSARGSGSA